MENKQKIKTFIDVLKDKALEYYPNESQKEERDAFIKNAIDVFIGAFEAGIAWSCEQVQDPVNIYYRKEDVLYSLKVVANDYLEKNNNN